MISCNLNMPSGPNTTVGELFQLKCEGDMPVKLNEPIQLVLPPTEPPDPQVKHVLKVSKVLSNDTGKNIGASFALEVYSHKAGEYSPPKLTFTDGVTTYESGEVKWKIATVVQQGDEMNPPYGPFERSYPLWFWLAILGCVLVVVAIAAHFQRRARIRRQLILGVLGEGRELMPFKELVKVQNSQAYAQFARDLRTAQKKLSGGTTAANKADPQLLWQEIEKAFRYYLVRELLTPAFTWSRRQLLSDIKKHHRRVYADSSRDLKQVLQELEKGRGQSTITLLDCEQLFEETRTTAEKIYNTRLSESRRWRSA
jgi:hypothetical protein